MHYLDDEEQEKNFNEIQQQWKVPPFNWQKWANYIKRCYQKCVTAKGKKQWTFGLYINMYKEQKCRCLICNVKMAPLAWNGMSSKYTAEIDHNHATNEVRALLCYRCNMCIGASRESRGILAKMIWYLDEYGNNSVDDESVRVYGLVLEPRIRSKLTQG